MVERTVTAEIVDIGNSKGLRIPKPIREELSLEGEVTLTVAGGALVVRPKRRPRADWADRFARTKRGREGAEDEIDLLEAAALAAEQ